MKTRLNFHSRVLIVFVTLLVAALFSASVAMFSAAKRTSVGLAEQQLSIAEHLVQNSLAARDKQLRESTSALAADFGFREAVASRDRPTIVSALENQGARINADVASLLNDAGVVIASTGTNFDVATPGAVSEALNHVRAHNFAPAIVSFDGRLLQLVIVPVRAPAIIGWICMGFYLRDDFVQEIKETSAVDVSLLAPLESSASVVASTLPEALRRGFARRENHAVAPDGAARLAGFNGQDYLMAVAAGKNSVADPFIVVLQMPMANVIAPMTALRRELLVSGAAILVLCLGAALLSARMLAKPVRALADAARSLSMSKRRINSNSAEGADELVHVAKAFHALAQRAHYDALTGLPNRVLFSDRLDEALERAKRAKTPVALVFVDLNGFKQINDSLGHEMGDLVLRKTAQRLTRSLGPPNTVARLGGDEFVLILEGSDQAHALMIVEKLIAVVAKPMRSEDGPIKVGMSAGIAIYPELSRDRDVLLKQADAAMYRSKTRKRGPVVAKLADLGTPIPSGAAFSTSALDAPQERQVDGLANEDTWNGQWTADDLSTQRTWALPTVVPQSGTKRAAAIPKNEAERLAVLRSLGILDTPHTPSMDRITRMAGKALNAPIALVSLVDENRQWFMSRLGIDASETPREDSFCAHAVFDCKPLVIRDATEDERFSGNPAVIGDPYIRAYAGAPIYARSGLALGTLCVVDIRPREFNRDMLNTLQEFAFMVEELIQIQASLGRPRPTAAAGKSAAAQRSVAS